MINLGKILSILFWFAVIAVYIIEPNWELTPYIKIAGIITINAHILEAFWFLSWKEIDQLNNIPAHLMKILLFGAFHIKPLRDSLKNAN